MIELTVNEERLEEAFADLRYIQPTGSVYSLGGGPMFVVWALLGGFLVWTLLGAWVGVNAALSNGFPVATGIVRGMLFGPLALAVFGDRRKQIGP